MGGKVKKKLFTSLYCYILLIMEKIILFICFLLLLIN